MAIVLMRHGEAEAGHDEPLTRTGEQQVSRISRKLADVPITKIYTAPEARTQQTAQTWSDRAKVPVEVVKDFAAWDLGRFRGDHSKAANAIVETLLDHPERPAPGGGESAKQYWSRFLPAVLPLIAADETYGVVGHSRGIKSIEALVRGNGSMDRNVWREPLLGNGHAVLVSREGFEPLDT